MKRGLQIHVWAGMGWKGATPLKFVEGNLNAQAYQTQILNNVQEWKKFCAGKRQGWFFQQDNAPGHRAASTQRFLTTRGIHVLPWPGNSPDLNPIENLWSWVEKRLPLQLPRNEAEFREQVQAVWGTIPTDYIHSLIASMPRRISAVVNAKGGPIEY